MKALPLLDPKAAAIDVGSEKLHVSIAGDAPKIFGIFTGELEALRDWFQEQGVQTVALEATGVYWLYLYEVLEAAGLAVVVVNGRHVQNVRGRKTDMATAQDAFTAARYAKRETYRDIDTVVVAADAFIARMVDSLKAVLGRRWSAAWAQAGFQRSLALPRLHSGRFGVLRSLETYLAANPTSENPAQAITHQAAGALVSNYTAARNTAGIRQVEVRTRAEARNQALDTAQDHIRGLLRELTGLISPEDPRWRQFGFKVPADPAVPEMVTGLTVAAEGPGALSAQWPRSARAERYHVELRTAVPGEGFRRVASVWDTNADLTGLTPHAHVQVRVIAAKPAAKVPRVTRWKRWCPHWRRQRSRQQHGNRGAGIFPPRFRQRGRKALRTARFRPFLLFNLEGAVQPRMNADGHGYQAFAGKEGNPPEGGSGWSKIRADQCSSAVGDFPAKLQLRNLRSTRTPRSNGRRTPPRCGFRQHAENLVPKSCLALQEDR